MVCSAVGLTAILTGCGGAAPGDGGAAAGQSDCITDFDPSVDYFPDKLSTEQAENFDIRYENSYQVLTVHEPFPNGGPESYVLLRCGAPRPELSGPLAEAQVIETPIDSLFAASTTHIPLLVDLDRIDVLTGVSGADYVSSPQARQRIDAGEVVDFAANLTIDVEQVVAENPDVLMTAGADDAAYPSIRDAGIPVLANAEHLETSPLGRAEWIKVMGALTGRERAADEVFDRIQSDYERIAGRAADARQPTPVAVGNTYQGIWSVPAGGSFVGRLISDAGGSYPWQQDASSGSLQLDFETVFARTGTAPIWLANTGWERLADVVAEDRRYAEFTSFRRGEVWNANRAVGPTGGNDFFERGVTRPDLVLADLVAILHPELMPDHEFTFYQRLPD